MEKYSYLSDLEKEAIIRFNADTILKEAVRKVMLSVIYGQGTIDGSKNADWRKNFALVQVSAHDGDNASLGEKMRAFYEGCNLMEGGFAQLEQIKPEAPKEEPKKNKAR